MGTCREGALGRLGSMQRLWWTVGDLLDHPHSGLCYGASPDTLKNGIIGTCTRTRAYTTCRIEQWGEEFL
jgi:hypothetical protein